MALLYTDPIWRDGFDVWVADGVVAEARPMLDERGVDEDMKVEIRDAIRRFEAGGRQASYSRGEGTRSATTACTRCRAPSRS